MIPLAIFLLACLSVYLGCIDAAFSTLMRLTLRLEAERTGRPGTLSEYLEDPVMLFVPVRLLQGLVIALATALLAAAVGSGAHLLPVVIPSVAGFVVLFAMVLPLIVVGRNPERVLEILLPSFTPIARALGPLTRRATRSVGAGRSVVAAQDDEAAVDPAAAPSPAAPSPAATSEADERRLLRSIVDFGDTLVREVMTPRPDIVAIADTATLADLRALFREQEYSRFPVYKDSLDNIVGFVFVKDLVALDTEAESRPVTTLLRQAAVVPESKRVAELLAQFQRQQIQIAIVVDEYGGTAGLVTLEDLLEEIVGEIRDEYDVESEPVVDEGGGRFVVSGKVDVDEVARRLHLHIEREGFETVGGYLLTHLGRVPLVGERFEIDGLSVEVLDVERRRIHKVRIARTTPVEAAGPGERVM
jgi:CBS domain containing-hemolysin-like protein